MMVRAAVAHGGNRPLTIEDIVIRPPGRGEVLVQMKASGLCHTDLSVIEGKFPLKLPAILGHEGSGIILECGIGVNRVKPGDHVILNNLPHCGRCQPCRSGTTNYCVEMAPSPTYESPVTWNGSPLATMGRAGTFATHVVLPEDFVTLIPMEMPFESACLIPCGVMTGVGAALFDAKIAPGQTAIVLGMGSIGLNVLQGARLAKASRIVGIDINPAREDIAREFGATDFVNSRLITEPLSTHVMSILGGPADYAFECIGNPSLIAEALAMTNPFSGVCIAVGIPPFDQKIELPATSFYFGRSLRGTLIGNGNPLSDTPKIVDWYGNRDLKIDQLVTHRLTLDQINDGFDLMRGGQSIRSVIVY